MAATDNNTPASTAHEHTCNDPTHHHDQSNLFDQTDLLNALANAGKKETPTKRKSKKKQANAVRAETIPGNRGSENIDDLVNFINGASVINEKKSKKKSA